jgi:2-dehydro-3-deoxyphosphogluconate aldolase/(4S)-4-hydroxy-2-oxoglutarate aldolase
MPISVDLLPFARTPVLPVVTLDDPECAVPLASSLKAGGISMIEVTLRTPRSLDVIRCIAETLPDMVLGVGTIRRPEQIEPALRAGAKFLVSPGLSPALAAAAADAPVPFLPGVATVSEALAAVERGFDVLKFFPAEANGGAAALRAFAGPLPDIRFCPTGGIDAVKAVDYLSLPNVVGVGGSWIVPDAAIAARDWSRITALAIETQTLRRAS